MFGPALTSSPDWVRYGPRVGNAVSKYTAASCTILVPHVSIECISVPGTGKNHWLQLSVGNQASAPYGANMSYAPPVIASFSGPGAGGSTAWTLGNVAVRITGER